ncbi:hypothetical protein [uncultured Devosia sp.]|uniref:hypothetical protein n=1 Tax=uncultured Devosia sp. TaxID=211434 RepID=UPI0035CA1FED
MTILDHATAARLTQALAAGAQPTIAVLSDLFTSLPGIRTATFIATAPDRTVTHRIGTSDPVHFPIGNVDPIDDGAWNRRIFGDRLPVIGNDVAGMAHFIPETDQLVALNYGAIACFPILIAGDVRGVVALLGDAGIFTPTTLADIASLLPTAALLFTFEGISER